MKIFRFVYMADENYVMPTVVSICSLTSNMSGAGKYEIHVILDNVPEMKRADFQKLSAENIEIVLHPVDGRGYEELSKKIGVSQIHVSRTDMLKFELADYMPEIDEILYLDGDLIVNKCIETLFDTDIRDQYVAAANDMGDGMDREGNSQLGKRIGLPKIHYFNAGVMYLNLKKIREDHIGEKLWEYRRTKKNYFMSQDALNYVLRYGRIELPISFNFRTAIVSELDFETINQRFYQGKYEDILSCIQDQTIIHMTDKLKPWIYNMPWFTRIFFHYYKKSPYASEKLTLSSPLLKKEQMFTEQKEELLWRIFVGNIKKGERVVLYGAGARGELFQRKNSEEAYCRITLWVDEYLSAERGITSPDRIEGEDFDKLVIAVANRNMVEEIRKKLEKLNIPEEKVRVIG